MNAATQINLYDYLQKLSASETSASNLSGEYDFGWYDSRVAFDSSPHDETGDADYPLFCSFLFNSFAARVPDFRVPWIKSVEEEKWTAESFYFLTMHFPRMLSENRVKSSEATLSTPSEFDRASDSHTGEVSRARAIERIIELKGCAREEQISINAGSQWDLLKFISGYTSTDDLNIFLLDGGTFRVIWKTSVARQLGFEFLGKGVLKKTVIVHNLDTGQYSASSELETLPLTSGF